jgi:hypothetical protein
MRLWMKRRVLATMHGRMVAAKAGTMKQQMDLLEER